MVLVNTCCQFLTLSVGTLIVGIFIIISSILGILFLLDVSDNKHWTYSQIIMSDAIIGGVVTSCALFLIGVVIIVGWSLNKFNIIKWASIALLVFSLLRLLIAFWRLLTGLHFPFFFVVLAWTLFKVYGCIVLWSFYQEERDIEIARSLRDRAPPLSDTTEATIDPGVSSSKK